VGVEQIRWRRPRDAQRDVGVDQLGHPVLVGQTLAGGQLDAQLALLRRYLTLASLVGCNRHHRYSFSLGNARSVRSGSRGHEHGAAAPICTENLNTRFSLRAIAPYRKGVNGIVQSKLQVRVDFYF
jgi:hypothetical protein